MNAKSLLSKPVISAAVGSIALAQVTGGSKFIYNEKEYSLHLLGAVLGAGSSFVSEVAHNYILPHIPGNMKYVQFESMVLSVASSGGAFVLASKLINKNVNMTEMRSLFIA